MMSDEESMAYFRKRLDAVKLDNWKGTPIVKDGKVRVLGLALQKMLVKGAPVYYVALDDGKRIKIYDLEYDVDGLLESCRKVVRIKRVDPHNVGFNMINGQSFMEACLSAGIRTPEKIRAANFYDFNYKE